ncbi:hypothetical protein EMIT07CA2_550118 [Brevibacillus sp. IT-7CA2]|uniref:hypothetical protein n=1 Tax=Brevibacillus sp. IT-7CA2 TaxID=3026436 RepID=UPI0039E1E892
MIDFEQVKNATSDEFADFVKETLREWQVDNYNWRLDTAWVGEVFLHVLVDKEELEYSTTTQLMQFVYRSGMYEFQNVNSCALKWLKENL